jgi:hypothetical protein
MIRATIWNKVRQRASREGRGALDLEGLHTAIADGVHALVGNDVQLRTAIPYQHEQGLPEALLAGTDVLVWWGPCGAPGGCRRDCGPCPGPRVGRRGHTPGTSPGSSGTLWELSVVC